MSAEDWTDAAHAMLRALCAEGLTFGKIAARLNAQHKTRFSRSAVIGKAARLDLSKRPRPKALKRKPGARAGIKPPKPATKRAAAISPAAADCLAAAEAAARVLAPLCDESGAPLASSLLALKTGACKWPIGDPAEKDFAFCARPVGAAGGPDWAGGHAYCRDHRQLAYEPAKRLKSLDGYIKAAMWRAAS